MTLRPRRHTAQHVARICALTLTLGLLGVAGAPALAAAPALSAGQQALNGYWRYAPGVPPAGAIAAARRLGGGAVPGASPMFPILEKMQPWAAAEFAKKEAIALSGKFFSTPTSRCMPSAMPGIGGPGGPTYTIHLMVEAGQVTFFNEADRVMRIVRLGAQHPATLAPSWLGHSVGKWEGDTLVIDTIGFSDQNVLANAVPVTHQMHIVQRLSAADGKMAEQASFDDPGALTGTLARTVHYLPAVPFQEYVCAENNSQGGVATASGQPTPFIMPTTPAAPTMPPDVR